MYKPSSVTRAAMSAAAALAALGSALAAPRVAAAQPYPDAPPPVETCHQEQTNHGVAGALIGGALGAVLGSQVAAHGHRTDGSLLGGGLGAITGAMVGKSSADCGAAPPPPPPPPRVAYAPPPAYAYAPPPPPPPPAYGQRWVYGYHGERYRITDRPIDPDGCTVAEGRLYLPDGRVEPNFVRVCLNPAGRFQIVG